jgi:hypothetical protein
VYEVSRRAWGLRLRRTNKGSRYCHCPCCLPHMLTASASGLYIFAAQSPTPPIPLFTLRRAPRDAQRKTRGQSGSLLLLCKASSSSASYRLSGRAMARIGLRMMPTFPSSPLKFRTAGFPQYGFKVGLSKGAFPAQGAPWSRPSGLHPSFVPAAFKPVHPRTVSGQLCA